MTLFIIALLANPTNVFFSLSFACWFMLTNM